MKISSKTYSVIVFAILLAISGCEENSVEAPTSPGSGSGSNCTQTISFKDNVQAIINTNCAISGCHNGSRGAASDYRNLSAIQARAQLVKTRVVNRTMPPSGELTNAQISAISCWVDQGALDN